MENTINLDLLPKEGDHIIQEILSGNMVVARSKNDFLYIFDADNEFHLFSHSTGSHQGGQKRFPKDEKHTAIVRNIANMADTLFKVMFNKDMNIYGVMYSAEEGILSMFPGENRDSDEEVEFIIPEHDNIK